MKMIICSGAALNFIEACNKGRQAGSRQDLDRITLRTGELTSPEVVLQSKLTLVLRRHSGLVEDGLEIRKIHLYLRCDGTSW